MNKYERFAASPQTTEVSVPGGVYLCQVSETVSCGACCGLYNVVEVSRSFLTRILRQRTLLFGSVPRTTAGIDRFARQVAASEPQQRPFEHFHHCPFIGLIGPGLTRVGCLLHPRADGNGGVDFRGLSYYGGLACRTYFCPATREMSPRYKLALRHAIGDWFLYGLVVTEKALIEALFSHIEEALGQPVKADVWSRAGTEAKRCLKDLLAIKCDWPYRSGSPSTVCHYLFDDGSYLRPAVDYQGQVLAHSKYDNIFKELDSSFKSAADLAAAEALVKEKITLTVRHLKPWIAS